MGITYECIKNVMNEVPTPCYIVSEALLEKNLKLLRSVSDQTGCKILLAQKAFSMYYYYPLIGKYLDGVTASGLYEARLGYEELCQKQVIDSDDSVRIMYFHPPIARHRRTSFFKSVTTPYLILFPSGQRTGKPRCGLASHAGCASILSARHKNMQFMTHVRRGPALASHWKILQNMRRRN